MNSERNTCWAIIPPTKPATALIVEGPYRFTRNPIYIGFTLLYFGIAIFATSVWMLLIRGDFHVLGVDVVDMPRQRDVGEEAVLIPLAERAIMNKAVGRS